VPISSRDGRLLFFDLRPYAARLRAASTKTRLNALRQATLHAPEVSWGSGFYPPEELGSMWSLPDATADIQNTTGKPRPMVFSAIVQSLAKGRWRLTLAAPDGSKKQVIVTDKPASVHFAFEDPPGTRLLSFDSTAPVRQVVADPRALSLHYAGAIIGDAGLAPFVGGSG